MELFKINFGGIIILEDISYSKPFVKLFMRPLKTVQQILLELDFLEYSTRKRNLAYQVQYLEFKINLLKSRAVYGAVQGCLVRDIVINVTNIIEYLLFISLRTIYGRDPKSHKFPQLIGQAKRNNLITKTLANNLNKIEELRNKLHPSKQKAELDIICFTPRQASFCLFVMNALEDKLREYFNERNVEVETAGFNCPYEGWSQALFPSLICPCCGGMHF